MKIRNLEDYYPKKEKMKRTKPRKKDLDFVRKNRTFKPTKK
jgi:hypothetical protein|tara:strand:- start:457 stop:579 length:123 start_codon:yes stop_codon:yes gene_type:complete